MGKIIDITELAELTEKLRSESKKIVTTNGAFDMLHIGHLANLEFAKKSGDILIVGLNSDDSIKTYKSKDRPIIGEKERSELVTALNCVDYAFIFTDETPLDWLKIIKPDFHVKGNEYSEKLLERDIVEKNGGQILFSGNKIESTTNIISKLENEDLHDY